MSVETTCIGQNGLIFSLNSSIIWFMFAERSSSGKHEAFWRLLGDLRFIRHSYDIRVKVGRRISSDLKNVSFERYDPDTIIANEGVASFRKILSKYPPEFIRFCGITQTRMVEKLLLGKHRYWKGHRTVGGLASPEGPIYVAGYDLEGIVHHEIFHRADQELCKLENIRRQRRRQLEWKGLNKHYTTPYLYGSYWQLTPEERLKLSYQGFAEPYGRVDIWEDRATVAELLMTDLEEAKIRMSEDKTLAQKAFIIYRDLYHWSGGRMNGRYFEALRRGQVDEEYWTPRPRSTSLPRF